MASLQKQLGWQILCFGIPWEAGLWDWLPWYLVIIVTTPNPPTLVVTDFVKKNGASLMDQDRLRICATSRAKCFQNMTCPALQTSISCSVRLQFLIKYSKPAVTSFFCQHSIKSFCSLFHVMIPFYFLWNNFTNPKWDLNLPKQKNQMVCHPPQGFHSKNFWLPIQLERHTIV